MGDTRRQNLLQRFFAGLAEQTFQTRLGVADPPLVDYISRLLVRFVHADVIYRIRDLAGRRLLEVADMLVEAQQRMGEARREAHRHVGDYILFWSGVYPETLARLQHRDRKDSLLDYNTHGKRAYWIAGTIPSESDDAEGDVLLRLSDGFELCQYGLREVRRQWESRGGEGDDVTTLLIN